MIGILVGLKISSFFAAHLNEEITKKNNNCQLSLKKLDSKRALEIGK
jgi:hypothetical protein